jgi:hypothetical protein
VFRLHARLACAAGLAICVDHAGWTQETPADRAPYTLASGFPTVKEPAAAVYTAALRAALVRETGRDRRSQAEPDADGELIHVVMSADTVMTETGIAPDTPMAMEVVPERNTSLVSSRAASRAVWVRHDPSRREPQLRGTEFFGVAVGAFRKDQLCAGCYVVLYRINRSGGNKRLVAAWAVIPENAGTWK